MSETETENTRRRPAITPGPVIGVVAAVVLTVGSGMVGCPMFEVWRAQKAGEAELAQAEQNRQIATAQAKAKAESARFEADAEVTRATGVAQANEIIGKSLQGNEAYLRYLWINGLEQNKNAVIYVPTEGNLPILEATGLMRLPDVDPTSGAAGRPKALPGRHQDREGATLNGHVTAGSQVATARKCHVGWPAAED